MGSAPPGWYPDPELGAGVRYWDGSQWSDQTAPTAPPTNAAATPAGWQPPPSFGGSTTVNTQVHFSTWITVLLVVVSLLLVTLVGIGVWAGNGNGHSSAGPAANSPGTTIDEPPPQFLHVYHPQLDAHGDPEPVKFTAAQPTAATAAVPRALFAVPAGADVVDPATARTVTQTLWDLRRDAIADQRNSLLQQSETGSALAIDGHRGCGCQAGDHFGAASGISVSVPHQHAFPASFFAELRTTFNGSAWGASLVFTRSSRTDPWRLAFAGGGEPVDPSGDVFPLALAPDGFTAAVAVQKPPVGAILADYWQRAKDDGTADLPPSLAPAAQTDEWAKTLVENRQGDVNSGNGLIMYYLFYADPTTVTYTVPLGGGTQLECSSILEQKTYLPGRGDEIGQPAARTNWGPDVAPGAYAAMITVSEYTPCFEFRTTSAYFQANGYTPADEIADIPIK